MNKKEQILRKFLTEMPVFQAVFRTVEAEGIMVLKPAFKEPILDLGCGDGSFAEAIISKNKNITGLDIDKNSLFQAAKKDVYQNLIEGDAHSLPFADNQFNSVLANSCLEHMGKSEMVLQEIFRVLAKGGILILTAPSEKRERLFLGGKWENQLFHHLNCWSGKRWQTILTKIGFKKVSYRYKCSPKTALIGDLLLVTAPWALLERKIFGHYLGWRKYIVPLTFLLLQGLEDKVEAENGAIIIVKAEK